MTKEQIEKKAREEWEKLGAFVNNDGSLKSHWEFFLKGIEIVINCRNYSEDDMKIAYLIGKRNALTNMNKLSPNEWLEYYNYELDEL